MSWTKEEFLKFLNDRVVFRGRKVQPKPESERQGQGILFPTSSLVFLMDVDAVFVGPCSDWVDFRPRRYDPENPFGRYKYTLVEEEKRTLKEGSVLAATVEDYPQAKTIMVFATCCGTYCDIAFKQSIERLHPNIKWVFPKMADLYTNWRDPRLTAELAQCLILEGIIGIQE